jgi:hypothetical protein
MSHPGTPMMTEVVGSTMRTGHCGTIPISLAYYVHPPDETWRLELLEPRCRHLITPSSTVRGYNSTRRSRSKDSDCLCLLFSIYPNCMSRLLQF